MAQAAKRKTDTCKIGFYKAGTCTTSPGKVQETRDGLGMHTRLNNTNSKTQNIFNRQNAKSM